MREEEVFAWVGRVLHSKILRTSRLATGNSRLTTSVVLRTRGNEREVILRHDIGEGPLSGTIFSLDREAAVCRALAGQDLPVPGILASNPGLSAIVAEKMNGSQDTEMCCLKSYVGLLAKLHGIDISKLELPGFTTSIGAEMAAWKDIYDTHSIRKSAAAALAFSLLDRARPPEPKRPVLCHGDAGFGNYLVDGMHVSALLDWEMAHFGDPVDDLVWIAIRAVQFNQPLQGLADAIGSAYGRNATLDLSRERIDFWKSFGLLRMLIICLLAVSRPRSGKERLLQLGMLAGLEFQLLESLAGLEGFSVVSLLDEVPLDLSAFPTELLVEAAADIDQAIVPALPESAPVRNWAKRIRNVMRELSSAVPASSEPTASGDLVSLARAKALELRWQPSAAKMARRAFPNLLKVSGDAIRH